MPTVHLLIQGKVQGVFYRATAKQKAGELGLTGWIKNTPQKTVEAVASGSKDSIQSFIDWCKKGPLNAIVSSVEITEIRETFSEGFQIIRG